MVIDRALVVVCTHNPEPAKIRKVFEAIKSNSAPFRLLVVDNASTNSEQWDFKEEFDYTLVTEKNLGNAYARKTALDLHEDDELLIFVDDDNLISSTYIHHAISLVSQHPNWGCYGGRQIQHTNLHVPFYLKIFLPYLGIRDLGPNKLECPGGTVWNHLEPIGAGMCLHPKLVKLICETLIQDSSKYFALGRKGRELISGEDSFFALQATKINMQWGYSPDLVLVHQIDQKRLRLGYLVRLLYGYGISDVRLSIATNTKPVHHFPSSFYDAFTRFIFSERKGFFAFILGFRSFGQLAESKRVMQGLHNGH